MKTLVLHHSVFAPNPSGHGGEKRSYQIAYQAQKKSVKFESVRYRRAPLSLRTIFGAFFLLCRVYGLCSWRSLRTFLRFLRDTACVYDSLHRAFASSEATTFLWESVRPEYYILPYLARQYGKSVIALPHNTESLVPQKSPFFRLSPNAAFQKEIATLSLCDKIYTISHEECWLLSLYHLPAFYYPYEPVGDILDLMTAIRTARAAHDTSHGALLLIGSAINPPTRRGMQSIIDYWTDHSLDIPLQIAGYGSDLLSVPEDSPYISFLGELSDTDLQSALSRTKGLLIYQPPTTGALTRIAEAIAANVPVYANYAAARSYHHLPLVHVYDSPSDLISLVQ